MGAKVDAIAKATRDRVRFPNPHVAMLDLFGSEPSPDPTEARPDATSDEWFTPPWLLAWLPDDMDLDPCWSPSSSVRLPTRFDIRAGQDGLALPWFGRVWVNPPYSNCKAWVVYAFWQALQGKVRAVVLLIPASVGDTFWHHHIWGKQSVVGILCGRVPFDTAAGPGKASGLGGSALVILGPERLAVHAVIAERSATHKRRPAWVQVL